MSSTSNNFNSTNNSNNNNQNNSDNNIQKNIRVLKSSEVIQNMIDESNETMRNYGIQIVDIYHVLKEKHGFTSEQASRFKKKARVSVTNGNWTVEKLFDEFDNDNNDNNTNNNSNSTRRASE